MKYIGHTLFNDWEYGGDKILKGTIYTKYKQFVENTIFYSNFHKESFVSLIYRRRNNNFLE